MRILQTLSPQLLIAALLAFAIGSVGNSSSAPLVEGEQQIVVPHMAGAPLSVETGNGTITAGKVDRRDVQITAKIAAKSAERLAAAKVVAARGPDHRLFVHCEWPDGGPKDRESCSFSVQIPDAVGVALTSENGDVSSSQLAGNAHLLTTNGNIDIDRHAGPIRARTTNGSVTIADAAGAVKADTANGALHVALAPNSAGPVELDGVNSSIELKIGPAFAGMLSLGTTNGRVTADTALRPTTSDAHEMEIDFGHTPQKSSATTVNGTIHIGLIDGDARQ
jgi:hypothetical protein